MSRKPGSSARRRLIRFVIVGAGANLLLFVLAYALLKLGMPASLAGALGYAIAFAAAYLAQREWTFEGKHDHRSAFPRYVMAQVACAATSGLVGHVCAGAFATSPVVTSAVITATAGVMSYLLSSRWVFEAAGER